MADKSQRVNYDYKPYVPFNVPMYLLIPETVTAKGSTKKIYPENGTLIYCSFRTFGGTEKVVNSVLTVENTAVIETWYRPDIKSDCILRDLNGINYEILGTPENLNVRNQFMRIKIRAVQGGA